MNGGGLSSKINQIGLAKMLGKKWKEKAQYKKDINSIEPGTHFSRYEANKLVGTLHYSGKETNNLMKYNNKIKSSMWDQQWLKEHFSGFEEDKLIKQRNFLHGIVTKSLIENLQKKVPYEPKQKDKIYHRAVERFAQNGLFGYKNTKNNAITEAIKEGFIRERSLQQAKELNTKGLTGLEKKEAEKRTTEAFNDIPKSMNTMFHNDCLISKKDEEERKKTVLILPTIQSNTAKYYSKFINYGSNFFKKQGFSDNNSLITNKNNIRVGLNRLNEEQKDKERLAEEKNKCSLKNIYNQRQETEKTIKSNKFWNNKEEKKICIGGGLPRIKEEQNESKPEEHTTNIYNNIIPEQCDKKKPKKTFNQSMEECKEEYKNNKNNNTDNVLVVEPKILNKNNEEKQYKNDDPVKQVKTKKDFAELQEKPQTNKKGEEITELIKQNLDAIKTCGDLYQEGLKCGQHELEKKMIEENNKNEKLLWAINNNTKEMIKQYRGNPLYKKEMYYRIYSMLNDELYKKQKGTDKQENIKEHKAGSRRPLHKYDRCHKNYKPMGKKDIGNKMGIMREYDKKLKERTMLNNLRNARDRRAALEKAFG